jgi:hypothetical protein
MVKNPFSNESFEDLVEMPLSKVMVANISVSSLIKPLPNFGLA